MRLLEATEKYQHISFDLWLTLIKSNPEYKVRRNRLFKDFFEINQPIETVAAAIRKFDVLTNSINEKVTKNFDTSEIYCLILDHLGVAVDSYSRQQLTDFYEQTDALLMQYKPLLLQDSLPNFLNQLVDEGKTLNILSNTAFIKGSSLRKIIEHYQLTSYFAFQVYSDEVGFSKPGTQIYDYAYSHIQQIGNIQKHEVLHVGDNKVSDYDGALAYGFGAYLLTQETIYESKLQSLQNHRSA